MRAGRPRSLRPFRYARGASSGAARADARLAVAFSLALAVTVGVAVGLAAGSTVAHASDDPSARRPPAVPWKALWVPADHLVTEKRIAAVLAEAESLGATDLFVQVRVRGDALYRSAFVPACRAVTSAPGPASLALKSDPLWSLLDSARGRGVRVHAWFNAFIAWSNGASPPPLHVLSAHPEWAVRLADGQSTLELSPAERKALRLEGAFLAPGSEEVRAHLLRLVEELARFYALDGIHFDYVRYPGAECIDPGEPLPMLASEPDTARINRQCRNVSHFVRDASRIARRARPGILVSAAVFPEPEDARRFVRQDWPLWLREGWIDRAVPMAYTESVNRLEDWRRRWDLAGADPSWVVAGLAVYRNDAEGLRRQIDWARRRSPGGVALFALEHLREPPARMRAARALRLAWDTEPADPQTR